MSPMRQPHRWDRHGESSHKRIGPRYQQAILSEYAVRTAAGEPPDHIVDDLAARLGKEPGQIERYILNARHSEEERILSLAQRVKARIDPRQTVHERVMREMARRLEKQVALPPSYRVFTVSRDNQYWHPNQLSWKLSADGRVQVILRLEHDDETRLPFVSLMEHLSSPGFSSVAPDVAQWKKKAADYLAACYTFASQVTDEVEAVLGTAVALKYAGRPAVLADFPLTICVDALERARSTAASTDFSYVAERLDGRLIQLRFGASAIAIATSAGKLDRLQREHYDLRNKHATSPRARTIADIGQDAVRLEARVRDKLHRFRLSPRVPGYCALCRPPDA